MLAAAAAGAALAFGAVVGNLPPFLDLTPWTPFLRRSVLRLSRIMPEDRAELVTLVRRDDAGAAGALRGPFLIGLTAFGAAAAVFFGDFPLPFLGPPFGEPFLRDLGGMVTLLEEKEQPEVGQLDAEGLD